MKKYDEFILEKQLELISESIVYFSPKLRHGLEMIKHPIAKSLLSAEGTDIKDDITLIDISKDMEGYLTFKTMKSTINQIKNSELSFLSKSVFTRIESDFRPNYSDDISTKSEIWDPSRNPIKLGRLINLLLPDKFTPKEIEEFINKFKSYQKGELGYTVKIVEGEEIAKWYSEDNYLILKHTLGSSCMRDVNPKFFDIYVKNPEVCKMVVLLAEDDNDEEKLVARALLWKPTDIINSKMIEFEWFMDRQYAISDADIEYLRKWANENGYAYKTNNNHSSFDRVTYKGTDFICNMEVSIKKQTYSYFPYMDTFRRFDTSSYILHNDDEDGKEYGGHFLLSSTSGEFEEINNGVWSEWHGEYIDADESVYSEPLDDYLIRDSSVLVRMGSRSYRGWWPASHDNIVEDCWNNRFICIHDAIYSEIYDGYILDDEFVDVVDSVDKYGYAQEEPSYMHINDDDFIRYSELDDVIWFKILYERKKSNWRNHDGVLKDILIKDSNGNWILERFQVKVYKVEGEDFDMEYLDKGIFKALNRDDIKLGEETKILDVFEYLYNVDTSFDIYLVKQKLIEASPDTDCESIMKFVDVYIR